MLASEVNNVTVKDNTEFDVKGNPVRYQQYTFFIADHGPFMEKFYAGEQLASASTTACSSYANSACCPRCKPCPSAAP